MSNPVGRPKTTLADLPEGWRETVIELGRQGKSQEYIAGKLGLWKELFYRLKAEEPEFSNAVAESQMLCQMWWEDVGQEGMFMGGKDDPFNATVYTFNMKNRFNWADKTENKNDLTTNGKDINRIECVIVDAPS